MNLNQMRRELVHLGGGAHALALQILGNVDDAADAVHDALAMALGRADSFDESRGSLKPWFLRIVRNRCIDLLRRRRPDIDDVDRLVDSAPGPDALLETADRDRLLKLALGSLPSAQRQIIMLRDYMDLSYAEIAGVLDIPAGTVMSKLHRARVALGKAYRKFDA